MRSKYIQPSTTRQMRTRLLAFSVIYPSTITLYPASLSLHISLAAFSASNSKQAAVPCRTPVSVLDHICNTSGSATSCLPSLLPPMCLTRWSKWPSKSTSKQEAGQKVRSSYYELDFYICLTVTHTDCPFVRCLLRQSLTTIVRCSTLNKILIRSSQILSTSTH